MKYSESIEMYLETILLEEERHGHAHVAEIAELLDVKMPSVTKAMDQLKNSGLIDKETYGTITLTEKGRAVAHRVYHSHQILIRFLEKTLHLSPAEAAENACRIEHVATEELLAAVERYLAESEKNTES